jgi:hypothetical protein
MDARFAALWDPRVYGSLMGMFELNNLSVFVTSPLQLWAQRAEEAGDPEQAEAAGAWAWWGVGGGEGVLLHSWALWMRPGPRDLMPQGSLEKARPSRTGTSSCCLPGAEVALDVLGDLEGASLDGTAFYALQSCANHSCTPRAHAFKRSEDVDGAGTLGEGGGEGTHQLLLLLLPAPLLPLLLLLLLLPLLLLA